jgi:hypothetical protein
MEFLRVSVCAIEKYLLEADPSPGKYAGLGGENRPFETSPANCNRLPNKLKETLWLS